LLSILFILSIRLVAAQAPISNSTREIVFTGVNVIPMDKEQVLENQTVVIRDGRITAMGTKHVKYGTDALVINATGKYLTPGWSEMHAHVPPIDDIQPMKDLMVLYLANGITTIRGMLGHPKHLELRSRIQSGEILGPNFYTTGPSFNGRSVPTPERGVEMVKEQKAAGYDYMKMHPGLTKLTFPPVVKTAHELDMKFVGHVSFDVGVWKAIEEGYSSIDHMDGFVEAITPGADTLTEQQIGLFAAWIAYRADLTQLPKLIDALKEKNVAVVPTMALGERWQSPLPAEVYTKAPEMKYMKPEEIRNWVEAKNSYLANPLFTKEHATKYLEVRRKLIYECYQQGVQVLLGSDGPQIFNVPGFSIHHEMKYLVNAGLTPYETLRTGTVHVAAYLEKENSGTIRVGNVADLVLLNGNPLKDIDQASNIEGVMIGRQWLSKAYLQAALKKLERSK
ncbi:MAG: amidohydrolase family protein, partial [Bacteroidota bacterium]